MILLKIMAGDRIVCASPLPALPIVVVILAVPLPVAWEKPLPSTRASGPPDAATLLVPMLFEPGQL
jgi:hypothetical protein